MVKLDIMILTIEINFTPCISQCHTSCARYLTEHKRREKHIYTCIYISLRSSNSLSKNRYYLYRTINASSFPFSILLSFLSVSLPSSPSFLYVYNIHIHTNFIYTHTNTCYISFFFPSSLRTFFHLYYIIHYTPSNHKSFGHANTDNYIKY